MEDSFFAGRGDPIVGDFKVVLEKQVAKEFWGVAVGKEEAESLVFGI